MWTVRTSLLRSLLWSSTPCRWRHQQVRACFGNDIQPFVIVLYIKLNPTLSFVFVLKMCVCVCLCSYVCMRFCAYVCVCLCMFVSKEHHNHLKIISARDHTDQYENCATFLALKVFIEVHLYCLFTCVWHQSFFFILLRTCSWYLRPQDGHVCFCRYVVHKRSGCRKALTSV